MNEGNNSPKLSGENTTLKTKRLYKSRTNKIFAGVCAGIAEYFNISPLIVRLLFALFILVGGWGVIVYILTAALLSYSDSEENVAPREPSASVLLGILSLFAGSYLVLRNTVLSNLLNLFNLPDELIVAVMLLIFGVILFVKRDVFLPAGENEREERRGKISGVFEELAKYTGINITLLRMLGLIFFFLSGGFGGLVYLILFFTRGKQGEENAG